MADDSTRLRHVKALSGFVAALRSRRPHVFRLAELRQAYAESRKSHAALADIPLREALELLAGNEQLQLIEVFPESKKYASGRSFTRYGLADSTALELASTLRKSSYLSHGTAAFLHGLSNLVPRMFYVNTEQSKKPPFKAELTQAALDRAFKSKQRVSQFVFRHKDARFTLLSGKHTSRFGVKSVKGPAGELIDATDLPRTLVDLVVRPVYAGGVVEVLEAYKAAKGRVRVSSILSTLEALEHAYPYHQSIGFFMERAGYSTAELSKLKSLGIERDFYLTHGMQNPAFEGSWRVYYPKSL